MDKNYDLADLNMIAKQIVSTVHNKTLLFYGSMGVGKTTLIKEICAELGTEDIISSPTFSLVNEYRTKDEEIIYHFDFYRIEDEMEAFDIGVEDYFDTDAWCLIEWPENIQNLLPLKSTMIHLTQLKSGQRNIQLKPFL